MRHSAPIDEFLPECSHRVLLDVRSPGEYRQGHIPGAVSFPLFDDDERARVGTLYKQQGSEVAMELGLEIAGPKMAGFVRQARANAPDRKLAVHCWRGGQRSGSMAWLFRQAGFDVLTLEGGYKAYRQHVLERFIASDWRLCVVGGRTGSGKTKILHALRGLGEQIIDLEGLAHHKGSAFGFIGEAPQPTVEQFENDLHDALDRLDRSRRIWIENESRSIGRVYIPQAFWQHMRSEPLFNIRIPDEARIENLLDDYTHTDKALLRLAFQKIDRKLGGQHLKAALEALEQDDYVTAAKIALRYYDKTYQYGLEHNPSPDIRQIAFETRDPEKIARFLIGHADS
ncbi:MAG: tRNA 2-selenouridine(34) synthase MnmH [Saprospiraceae bacterium]|nr:tRNA 2-selenouridine(34) synthase MnmH [Saprospiraceae bacterium]MCB9355835.1 tRNA 2-selenouridine(34) synthase MnmH [Lewinellaceae bacterium]